MRPSIYSLSGGKINCPINAQPSIYWASTMCQCCAVLSCSVMSDSLRPQRLLCPWDSPGKNTGVSCHYPSRGSSQPRDRTQVSCIAGGFFITWAIREAHQGSCWVLMCGGEASIGCRAAERGHAGPGLTGQPPQGRIKNRIGELFKQRMTFLKIKRPVEM